MKKPQNFRQLSKLVGKQAIVTYDDGKNIQGRITGFSAVENNQGVDQTFINDLKKSFPKYERFSNVFFNINSKPKSYNYTRVEIIEEPTWLKGWIKKYLNLKYK